MTTTLSTSLWRYMYCIHWWPSDASPWGAWQIRSRIGKSRQLAATANQISKSATGFVFQSTSNSSGEATSSGTRTEKKHSGWWGGGTGGSRWIPSFLPSSSRPNRGENFAVSSSSTLVGQGFWEVKRGWGMSWNRRRCQWRQQESLYSGFTVLPQQTLSVALRRSCYCSQTDNTWNTSPVWCSALTAGWINNILIQVSLNNKIKSIHNGCEGWGGADWQEIPLNMF